MTPNEAITGAFELLPEKMRSKKARLMLLAINLQEDPRRLRKQVGGPAKSLWQGEKTGGIVRGVRRHPATKREAAALCESRGVSQDDESIYNAIEHDDILAAGLARLLLWTDPKPLPAIGEVRQAFDLYLRTWRPGAYTRGTTAQQMALYTKWQLNYAKAMDQINA